MLFQGFRSLGPPGGTKNLHFPLYFQGFRGFGAPGESKNNGFSLVFQGFGREERSKGFPNSTKLESSKANGLLRFTSIQVNADHAVKPHVHSSNLGGKLGKHGHGTYRPLPRGQVHVFRPRQRGQVRGQPKSRVKHLEMTVTITTMKY